MDSVHPTCRCRRTRTSCPRRARAELRVEALEERTLLSLTLINDINPAPLLPAEITGAGGNVYFVTKASGGGAELNVETATGPKILKEFPAPNSIIDELTPDGSKLFFFATPALYLGDQLWVTNGTRAGTRLVENTSPGGILGETTVVGKELYFASSGTGSSPQPLLYKTNGTAAGTVPIANPVASATSHDSFTEGMVNDGGVVYFGFGNQLMKTNGVTSKVVGSFGPRPSTVPDLGSVSVLTDAGGVLYFTSRDPSQ